MDGSCKGIVARSQIIINNLAFTKQKDSSSESLNIFKKVSIRFQSRNTKENYSRWALAEVCFENDRHPGHFSDILNVFTPFLS